MRKTRNREKILTILRSGANLSPSQIRKLTGISERTLFYQLSVLMNEGIIEKVGHKYRLVAPSPSARLPADLEEARIFIHNLFAAVLDYHLNNLRAKRPSHAINEKIRLPPGVVAWLYPNLKNYSELHVSLSDVLNNKELLEELKRRRIIREVKYSPKELGLDENTYSEIIGYEIDEKYVSNEIIEKSRPASKDELIEQIDYFLQFYFESLIPKIRKLYEKAAGLR
ncbi:MAG: winged helix-turn-helix domain-containing protein [Nitrososphaerota archaeon]